MKALRATSGTIEFCESSAEIFELLISEYKLQKRTGEASLIDWVDAVTRIENQDLFELYRQCEDLEEEAKVEINNRFRRALKNVLKGWEPAISTRRQEELILGFENYLVAHWDDAMEKKIEPIGSLVVNYIHAELDVINTIAK